MMGHRSPRAAVLLDRDDTLIRDVGYLRRADQIEIVPRVPAVLRLLRKARRLPAVRSCRKSNSGMIERACEDLGLNPAVSYVVGDQESDIELAERIGGTALLDRALTPLVGIKEKEGASMFDLRQAAKRILEHSKQPVDVEES